MHMAREQKIPIIGIDYEDKPDDARHFIDELGDPFRAIGIDQDGRLGIEFGVYGVPETYVIDKSGRIRFKQVGGVTPEVLEGTLIPMLKKLAGS